MHALRLLPLAAGTVACLSTAAMLAVHLILAVHLARAPSVRITSIVSGSLDGVLLVVLGLGLFRVVRRNGSIRQFRMLSGVSALLCALAAATSVATTVMLGNARAGSALSILGASRATLLIISAVLLGVSVLCQLLFIISLYSSKSTMTGRGRREEYGNRLQANIKAVRYSRTIEVQVFPMDSTAKESSPTPPPSSSGKSAAETMNSSYAARSITSRTRLLSLREKNHTHSFDSQSYREGSTMTVDSFDSWDVPGMDHLPSRLSAAQGSATPTQPHRFLEPIPASPTTSKVAGPGTTVEDLELPPPGVRRRSRSYSPARRPQRDPSLPEPPGEAHIHPLFRTDSPIPPPNVTPGTVVTAAPDAGRVISDRQSARRMRSGSLPTTHGGPGLSSKKNSFDTFSRTASVMEMEEEAGEGEGEGEATSERVMTPPIPEWILSAGARSSLGVYESRKLKVGVGVVVVEKKDGAATTTAGKNDQR
ncbi:hypothetical protein SODALDRAFT_320474 [Sodiomyces alkalinus F11]|uniref:Uncharacterized protein n=1 Tax=Sodiomyces alkalinus (strain CBS 110278 / VKM F-3762 / F11) TaxID=1314773 RepID=A0A3N2PND7_SODAK|nr:hypothetical protein SODALDRAFT_320474 [Sodiomyces alkalinus F11]ROT36009.1 hypothetical protein SODALDRAFT_320474 [Sodiomyces alkalinus F11]